MEDVRKTTGMQVSPSGQFARGARPAKACGLFDFRFPKPPPAFVSCIKGSSVY